MWVGSYNFFIITRPNAYVSERVRENAKKSFQREALKISMLRQCLFISSGTQNE